MCVKTKAKAAKEWVSTSNFVQNQLWSIITVIFFGGVTWSGLGSLKEDVRELKSSNKAVHEVIHLLDRKTDVHEIKINHLEKWVDRHTPSSTSK